MNGANSTGFMIAQSTSKNGIRMSAARAFIRPVQDRPNLHVMLNTTVTKVLVHPKSKNAQGVEVVDAYGHTMKILSKKEVIVSGGAVNSPQILMLSGIGPKEELTRVRANKKVLNYSFSMGFQIMEFFIRFRNKKNRLASVQLSNCQALERICITTLHSSQTLSSMTRIHRH